MKSSLLTPRWTPLRHHDGQWRVWTFKGRFIILPAGRRSGKTELAKRRLIQAAMRGTAFDRPRFFAGAPTWKQAKRIYWEDLKALTPKWAIDGRPQESELMIPLVNGAQIFVVGMDVPARIEGDPWDGCILDEYGNMKKEAWDAHVRPALSDRKGWAWMIGVPEGRNHYYKTFKRAMRDKSGDYLGITWKSADILPPEEIEAAKRDLDPMIYRQEYEADFLDFTGRAYHTFSEFNKASRLPYDPRRNLVLCLDFNVDPGVAAIVQEGRHGGRDATLGIGEVWIPRNSTTPAVMRKFLKDWGEHLGSLTVYGDASGGSRGSAKVDGSDWDLVKQILNQSNFRGRYRIKVPAANPPERVRVNSVNSRFENAAGERHAFLDEEKCPHLIEDFEGVRILDGGSGEIDKKADPERTHISDAFGYYVVEEFPIQGTFQRRYFHG